MINIHSDKFKKLYDEVETPAFIFSKQALRNNLQRFRELFPTYSLFYSVKTNPLKEFLEVMKEEGVGFDTATVGEIDLAASVGAAPSTFIFTHPLRLPAAVEKAHAQGVENYILDSLDELQLLVKYAPGRKYYIRLLPPSEGTFYEYTDKFGASRDEIGKIMQYAEDHSLLIHGMSFHVGSQAMSVQPWVDTLRYAKTLINEYYETMPSFRIVNIGSGYPFNYHFDECITLETIAQTVHQETKDFPNDVQFWAEPGRILVADTGVLVCTVIKNLQRAKNRWLYVNIGVYHALIEILESRGKLTYTIESSRSGAPVLYNVSGNTLDPDDTLAKGIMLPDDIQSGDKLIIKDIGAYTTSLHSSYHALPNPNVYYIDNT